MKNISPGLLAILFPPSGIPPSLFVADLYRFDLIDGNTSYYTSGDQDIIFGGHTYVSGAAMSGPYFDRTQNKAHASFKIGLEVDTVSFDVIPGSGTIQGQPFLPACKEGVFDGAMLTISRAFMEVYGELPEGVVQWFFGDVGELTFGRNVITFNAYSPKDRLNQQMPRNVYQASCLNTLYDGACALNKASYAVSGSVVSGSSASMFSTSLGAATGYYNLGMLKFTSGANEGVSRTIKTWVNGTTGTLSFIEPFPNPPQAGDTFTIYPGCNKTKVTCQSKFSNLANFRGMPFIPPAETAV